MSVHTLGRPWANEEFGLYEQKCLELICPILEKNGYKLLYNCSSSQKRVIRLLHSHDIEPETIEKLFRNISFLCVEPKVEKEHNKRHDIQITCTFAKNERWTWGLQDPASYETETLFYETYF